MTRRTRLIARLALIAIGALALPACSTTSAATLLAPAAADSVDASSQTAALAAAPSSSVNTQGITDTIVVTLPGEAPVQQQEATPIPSGVESVQIAPTPVVILPGAAVVNPQPVYPPQPIYPPQPAYPPIRVPPVQGPVSIDAPGVLGLHIVQPGDTLYCIGRAYQVDPIAIAQANSVSGYAVIVPGHALLIPATRWTNIPAGPVCRPQFAVDWSQPSAVSVTAAPLCGYVAFNAAAPPPSSERFSSADIPSLVSTGSFTNGYGETIVITVTGRRPDAIAAFTSNTPVCIGVSRPQPAAVPVPGAEAQPALSTGFAQTPAPQLSVTDILTDPNTFNLVIEYDLIGDAAQRYGPATSISFAIDPSIAPNATHYFYAKYRNSALAYLTANAGGITGTLFKNCQPAGPSQTLVVGQFNLTPLAASGSAYYGLTVIGRPGTYGFNGYNVAGTWGNLEAVPGAMNRCP